MSSHGAQSAHKYRKWTSEMKDFENVEVGLLRNFLESPRYLAFDARKNTETGKIQNVRVDRLAVAEQGKLNEI